MNEGDNPLIRVMALHALAYCERLFYLEEVEGIHVADDAVYVGRNLHEERSERDPSGTESRNLELSSQALGLVGKVDAVRQRDGVWVPYEHKRGRARRRADGSPEAWRSDRLQVVAYALLLQEELGQPIPEGRVRYHADNVTVRVAIGEQEREELQDALDRVRELRSRLERPPVTDNPNLCPRCSLAPICLPEEGRVAQDSAWSPARLFPPSSNGQIIHVLSPGSRVKRSGQTLAIVSDGAEQTFPVHEVHSLVLHGMAQITAQALHLCAAEGIPVHWLTRGGRYIAGLATGSGGVQRRLRQYQALADPSTRLRLARRLAHARIEGQLRYLLRATRAQERGVELHRAISIMRRELKAVLSSEGIDAARGHEGVAARAYFERVPDLLGSAVPRS